MDREARAGGAFEVDRKLFEPLAIVLAGLVEKDYREFENEFFAVRPYQEQICTGWENDRPVLIEETRPNFEVKQGQYQGFRLAWYKHPMRAARCSMPMTENDVACLTREVLDSLKNDILFLRQLTERAKDIIQKLEKQNG